MPHTRIKIILPTIFHAVVRHVPFRLYQPGAGRHRRGDDGNNVPSSRAGHPYDHASWLAGVTQGSDVYSFAYLGSGDRIGQTVNGVMTTYALDLNAGLTQVLSDGTNTYLYGNEHIGQFSTSESAYFLGDALGSVRQLADSGGSLILTRAYEPYGEMMNNLGGGSSVYGFTGEWASSSTNLLYLRARFYDPNLNQFIQADPIVPDPYHPWEWNSYTYSRNNPVNYTDPSGFCAQGDEPCLKAAQKLFHDYGWYFIGQWQVAEIELLRDAAKEIAEFFDDHGGNGQARMRGAMSPVWFTRGGLLWNILGYHHVEAQKVYLLTGFSHENVVHESAHLMDNLAGSAIYASIFGGGPSYDMARSLGVDPTQCPFRFSCSKYFDLLREAKAELPPSTYARNGSSEDFAVTFEYLVTGNGAMQNAPVRSDWMARFIEGNKRIRPVYEGNPYQYLWFLPRPVPVPECSLPRVLVTPQP